MKWIKASERLPEKDGEYYCRWSDKPTTKFVSKYKKEWKGFIDDHSILEWLDEEYASQQSPGAIYSEEQMIGFAEVVKKHWWEKKDSYKTIKQLLQEYLKQQ